jgi:serine/threonine protein kinase
VTTSLTDDISGVRLGGRYLLRRRLGAGGMGVVYEAWQEDLARPVAVKLVTATSPDALARFQREAQSAAALGHPHIVQIYDFQMPANEPPFLVMELLQGRSLLDAFRQDGPLGAERAARIGIHVLSALGLLG